MMFEYAYDVSEWGVGWELQYVAGKLYSALDTTPAEGLFDGQMSFTGDQIILYFYRELTPSEVSIVEGVMGQSDVGAFPDLQNKVVVEIPNFLNDWRALETAIGLDIGFAAINPYNGSVFLVLNDVPNGTKKNQFFQGMRSLVKITKNGLSV